MNVVEVIPVVKGITRQSLSYFTKEKFEPGSFVRIPLRKGSALGIVSSTADARKAKAELKGASFALRKLSVVERAGKLSPAFMKAVSETANFYASTSGSVFKSLTSKIFLENPELFGKAIKTQPEPTREIKLVQLSEDERFREYRGIVRESFARGASTVFVVSTKEEAVRAEKALCTGIEKYVYNSVQSSPKLVKKLLLKARDERHPILFIATPPYLAFDRKDFKTYILERENSRSYRTLNRPYISIKKFLEFYAKAKGAQLIFGDSQLSLESLWYEREGIYSEFTPLTWRLKYDSVTEMVDMKTKKEFELFSPRLKTAIESALNQNKKVFIYAARKGFSSTTICGDCASLLLCKNCSAPLVLLNPPLYLCRHCGAKRSAETRCDNCQSWKLTPLGIGIDRVAEEAAKVFENTNVLVLDKDHAPNAARAKSIARRFNENNRTILVGSDLALLYLTEAHLVAAASLDALFSIPDFFINERIFYLITRLRELAKERFILQTRNAGAQILEYAGAGNILDFYRLEILEREELRYPPFSIFVKVSVEDSKERIERKAASLQSIFADFKPHFMLSAGSQKGLQVVSMIIRTPRVSWPNKELVLKLLLLTPDFTVKVDPEGIL